MMQAGSPVLTCAPPTPVGACPLACSSYYPIGVADRNAYDGGTGFVEGSQGSIDGAGVADSDREGRDLLSSPSDLSGSE